MMTNWYSCNIVTLYRNQFTNVILGSPFVLYKAVL